MTLHPTISIIVPMFNCERFILDTIQTVRQQTMRDWELLLMDDCSTDRTCEIARSVSDSRIHVLTCEQNHGAYYARNRGLETANGRYIAFLDADDLWNPNKLELQLSFMQQNSHHFTFTSYEFADTSGNALGKIAHVPSHLTYRQALKNTIIFTSTVMFDQSQINPKLFVMPKIESEDTATWWTVLKAGHIAYGLDQNLTYYRRSQGSLSSDKLRGIWRIWNLYRNFAHFSIPSSAYYFVFYAIHATVRRL